ncbi:unnamed protein product [Peronospora belbahrii]|uniref:Uncharacterized protein n=1 Tax=Peronospora belbahrii TaxID=622444 RepID=A0AAU9KKU2_9STRA|nr:unnamed protein product [Peronospora belbahrii]CAH0520541.1 unnamed protein product [Peronospora belbahrii]
MNQINREELSVLTDEALTKLLQDIIQRHVKAFKTMQVQILLTSESLRAKFEYELLQHVPELEVLVLKRQKFGGSFVVFTLPLLVENLPCESTGLLEKKRLNSMYIPDGFIGSNFSVTTNGPTIFIGYPMQDDVEENVDGMWPLVIEWPEILRLSSQVTQFPLSSEATSSIELIASCREMFLQQWRKRKDFIAELRRHVIVLEYDAVDFSQVFFMLQEQLNAQAPLRITVLRLEFTTIFFLTNSTSDLKLTLLDGEDGASPVNVALHASSTSHNLNAAANCQSCVAQFLENTQKGLLLHFYGE